MHPAGGHPCLKRPLAQALTAFPWLGALGNAEARRVQAQIHQAAQEKGLCLLSLQGQCRGGRSCSSAAATAKAPHSSSAARWGAPGHCYHQHHLPLCRFDAHAATHPAGKATSRIQSGSHELNLQADRAHL